MGETSAKLIFDKFDIYFPTLTVRVEEIVECYDDYIVCRLNDGRYVRFDNVYRSIKYYDDLSCLHDKANPKTEEEWRELFRIKLLRQMNKQGYLQIDLAEETGISQATITRYTSGTSVPNAWNLLKICNILNCTPGYLIDL